MKTKTAKYISRFASLSIAIKSAHYNTVGQDKVLVQGQRIKFEGGYYETDDPEIIIALEKREDFNSAFVRVPENKTVSEMHNAMTTNDEQKRIIKEQQAEIDRLSSLKVEGEKAEKNVPKELEELTREQLNIEAKKVGVTPEEIASANTKGDLIKIITSIGKDGTFDV